MRFVLTGKAVVGGQFETRDTIMWRLNDVGDAVVDSFNYGADVLVASRSDTQKAVSARALGKPVWTYSQLQTYINLRQSGTTEGAAYRAVGLQAAADAVASYGTSANDAADAMRRLGQAIQYPASQIVTLKNRDGSRPKPVALANHMLAPNKRLLDL